MATNLLDLLSRAVTPDILKALTRTVGESGITVQNTINALIPHLLGGLAARSARPSGPTDLQGMLTGSGVDPSLSGSLSNLLNSGQNGGIARAGTSMLDSLFGADRASGLGGALGQVSGMKPANASALAALVTPLAFSVLKNFIGDNRMSASGLASLLRAQKPYLEGKLDGRMTAALGLGAPNTLLSTLDNDDGTKKSAVMPPTASRMPWYIAGGALLVLLAVLGRCTGGGDDRSPPPAPATTPAAPQSTPTPLPAPTAEPQPSPASTPEPTPAPAPEPAPTPAPEPAPTPAPEPAPTPAPEPASTPAPEPAPTPAPGPAPTPMPEPASTTSSEVTPPTASGAAGAEAGAALVPGVGSASTTPQPTASTDGRTTYFGVSSTDAASAPAKPAAPPPSSPASADSATGEAAESMKPVTEPPATEPPATEAPATEPPATKAPATKAPATEAPATKAPATEAPTPEENGASTAPQPTTHTEGRTSTFTQSTVPVSEDQSTSAPGRPTSPGDGASASTGSEDVLPARVYFETNKSDIDDEGGATVRAVAKALASGTKQIVVTGYTDRTGFADINEKLARERAQAVKSALEAAGVPADRIDMEPPMAIERGANGVPDREGRRVEINVR